jgi:hypothetical protein
MIKAYQALWIRLTSSGTVKPITHILDNEASAEFKKEIRKNCTITINPTIVQPHFPESEETQRDT